MFKDQFIKKISEIFFPILLIASLNFANAEQYDDYIFYLQPIQDSKIYLNDELVIPEILSKTNTLALVKIKTNGKNKFNLKLGNKEFETYEEKINLKEENKKYSNNKIYHLFQLKKIKNLFTLKEYWSTGKEPKSVKFINNDQVILPLLDGNAFDIINVHTGSTQRISVPEKLSKKNGFVESLIINEKNELWISQMTNAMIFVFNLDDLQLKKTIQLSGKWSKVLLYNQNKKQVYVSNWLSGDISVIDAETYKEIYKIKVDSVPRGMLLSNDENYLYVAQFSKTMNTEVDGRLIKFNLHTKKIIKQFGIPGSKRHLVGDKNYIYVSDMGHERIEVYDKKNDTLIKNIKVFSKPNTIVLSPDEKYLFVSCRGPNNPGGYLLKGLTMGQVNVIDTNTLEVVDHWEGGNQSTGLDISANGKFLVSSDFKDDKIRVYKKIE